MGSAVGGEKLAVAKGLVEGHEISFIIGSYMK